MLEEIKLLLWAILNKMSYVLFYMHTLRIYTLQICEKISVWKAATLYIFMTKKEYLLSEYIYIYIYLYIKRSFVKQLMKVAISNTNE